MSGFGILVSVQMVIVAALGGGARCSGRLIGALLLVPLQTATNNTWFGGGGSGTDYIPWRASMSARRYEPGACTTGGSAWRPT